MCEEDACMVEIEDIVKKWADGEANYISIDRIELIIKKYREDSYKETYDKAFKKKRDDI